MYLLCVWDLRPRGGSYRKSSLVVEKVTFNLFFFFGGGYYKPYITPKVDLNLPYVGTGQVARFLSSMGSLFKTQ